MIHGLSSSIKDDFLKGKVKCLKCLQKHLYGKKKSKPRFMFNKSIQNSVLCISISVLFWELLLGKTPFFRINIETLLFLALLKLNKGSKRLSPICYSSAMYGWACLQMLGPAWALCVLWHAQTGPGLNSTGLPNCCRQYFQQSRRAAAAWRGNYLALGQTSLIVWTCLNGSSINFLQYKFNCLTQNSNKNMMLLLVTHHSECLNEK